MSLDKLNKYRQDKKALEQKISNLESKNYSLKNKINEMMPAYLKQRIIGYHREEIRLGDIHKFISPTEAENLVIQTDWSSGSIGFVGEEVIRKSLVASVSEKEKVVIGRMHGDSFSIYKEDDFVKVFHGGIFFHTRGGAYSTNKITITKYEEGDVHADILVEVLWCDKFIQHTFKINVARFNEFYEKNKTEKDFKVEPLSEENLKFLSKPAPIKIIPKKEEPPKPIKPEPPSWLVIGKRYRVKSKFWFNANKNKFGEVVQDEARFWNSNLCDQIVILHKFCENLYKHENDVEVINTIKDSKSRAATLYIPIFAIEPDPTDTREFSTEIVRLKEEFASYKFVFCSSNGTGAGEGELAEMKDIKIRLGYDTNGHERLFITGDNYIFNNSFTIDVLKKLLSEKKISENFRITEHSSCTTEVKIGNTRKEMPGDFKWDSFH